MFPGDEPDPGFNSVHPDAASGGGSLTHSGFPCLSPPPTQGQQKQVGVSQRGCIFIKEKAKTDGFRTIIERGKKVDVNQREGKNRLHNY